MNKKIAIIGTVGIPAKYGGFETLTEYLTKNLSSIFDLTVYCSAKNYSKRITNYNGVDLKYINLNANGIQSILYDSISIFRSFKNSDSLLILGVSGCIVLPIVKRTSNVKILINIDGLEWKRAKWGRFAKWFLKLSERIAVKYADEVIVDNKVIQDYVKSEYNYTKSHLIAYGADHVSKETLDKELSNKYQFIKNGYALKVCRIEPENNIDVILKAFSMFPEKKIVCIGNWSNSDYGEKLKIAYSKYKNIFLLDPIYDQQVLNQFRSNCNLYLHGHSAGGTNPSLVEAMYLGLPIFAYGVDYNKETTKNKALYFDNTTELLSLLKKTKEKQLIKIGSDMKNIAEQSYTWDYISTQYSKLF
jgi:glycosyltransferase involved in cell wall biosynthesis